MNHRLVWSVSSPDWIQESRALHGSAVAAQRKESEDPLLLAKLTSSGSREFN